MDLGIVKTLQGILPKDKFNEYFLNNEPQTLYGKWISTSDTSGNQDNTFMADSYDAFVTELEKTGQASASIPSYSELVADPYPARLRPVFNMDRLKSARFVAIIDINMWALDVTVTGGTGQDADTLLAISNSLVTTSDAYVQTKLKNTILPYWQPNYFRPSVLVGGTDLFESLQKDAFGGTNKGDMSIGYRLPFQETRYELIEGGLQDPLNDIQVRAFAGQYIKSESKIQRYPVECEIKFIYVE